MEPQSASEIEAIAALAPTLKEAELRVLLELARRRRGRLEVAASSRDLAAVMRVSRPWLQKAIDHLADRKLITATPGTTTQPAKYRLDFIATQILGGSAAEPPLASLRSHPGIVAEPLPGFAAEPGSAAEPPWTEPKPTRARDDRSSEHNFSIKILDRLARANPKTADKHEMAEARKWLHGYMAKFGREPNPHPPDDRILAQLLAIAPGWPRFQRVLYDLMAERKEPGSNYAWFAAVAMQRIHGVPPEAWRSAREEFRIIRRAGELPHGPPAPTTQELLTGIATAARKKAMP